MDELNWSHISDGAERLGILELLSNSDKFPSRKEAKRLLQQGGVKIDGTKATIDQMVEKPQSDMIIQAGKRLFFKVLPQ